MSRITVIGGTGYAGSAIVAEAASRGYAVTAVSRNLPAEPLDGVTYLQGTALDAQFRAGLLAGADVIVSATSPRGDMAGQVLELNSALAAEAPDAGVTLVVVGGFSSLRPEAGAPRFIEGEVDERFRAEAAEGHATLEMLLKASPELQWIFVSPAGQFGAYAPGEATGTYRLGGDVALRDANGVSAISAEDFALAIVDVIEIADVIESGDHRREHISAAY